MNATDVPAPAVGSGQDGQLLRGTELSDLFEGSEQPTVVLTSEKGIKHERDDETKTVTPGEGCAAVAAITDERVLLVVGGNSDDQGNPNRNVSLPYTEIRSVESKKGMLKSRLSLTARTSDRYHFLVGGREDLSEIVATIERAISHWVAMDRRLSKAKEHLSTIDDRLGERAPDAAADAYRRTRDLLDEARDIADRFRDGSHAMHRRIEQVETRLRMNRVRGHRVRGEQHVDEAEAARDAGDFQTAFDAYRDALEQYDRAESLATEINHARVGDLGERRREIERALSRIKTGPLVSAMDACEQARNASDPLETVDAWQVALRRCHDALVLVHGHDGFDGDYDALRCQVEWAVGNLLDAHESVIDSAETEGDEARDDDPDGAIEAYRVALAHAESARSVADEFRTGSPDRFRTTGDRLRGKLAALTDE